MDSLLPHPTQRESKRTGQFYPLSGGHPELREIGTGAWLAFGAVAVGLLIACFNVATLLMARAAERQKEISIRSALDASRARILRPVILEGLLLASVSGAAALLVAAWSAELLATFSLPSPISATAASRVDPRWSGSQLRPLRSRACSRRSFRVSRRHART